jgi:hypothetical protein
MARVEPFHRNEPSRVVSQNLKRVKLHLLFYDFNGRALRPVSTSDQFWKGLQGFLFRLRLRGVKSGQHIINLRLLKRC